MKKLLISLLLAASAFADDIKSANDFSLVQINGTNNGQNPRYLAPAINSVWSFNASGVLVTKPISDFTTGGATWGSITGTLSSQTDLQAAFDLKSNLASPTFSGTPAAPTAAPGTNTTQLATTAFVANAVSGGGAVTSVVGQTGAVTGTQILADGTIAAALAAKVPTTRTVNGHALSADVTVTKGDVGLSNVENTALSTWAGSTSLTTLGTIGTGIWQGTAITDTYISSAATWNGKQNAITFGTGVQTALGVNIGSAGAPVLYNGAGGTPSSIALPNATGFPFATGGTGVVPAANGGAGAINGILKANGAGLVTAAAAGTDYQAASSALTVWAGVNRASGFDVFTTTPSSANLASLMTDETGTGALVFANTPTLVTPNVGAATGTSLTVSGAVATGAGTNTNPAILLRSGTGMHSESATEVTFDIATVRQVRVQTTGTWFMNNVIGFNFDAGISRVGPASFAMGNSTSGNTSGSLALTNLTASGVLNVAGDAQFGKTVIPAGTTGAQTINKTSGSVNFAAGATTLVVTNSLASTTSVVQVTVTGNDITAKTAICTKAAGSITIRLNAAATAETSVDFLITN